MYSIVVDKSHHTVRATILLSMLMNGSDEDDYLIQKVKKYNPLNQMDF